MSTWLAPLLRLINAVLDLYHQSRRQARQNHVDAVRRDPAHEWLHKFGGTDKRQDRYDSPGSDNTGCNRD